LEVLARHAATELCQNDLPLGVWVMENLVMRRLIAIAVAAAALFAVGCSADTGHPAASPVPLLPDQHTSSALLKIASQQP
jgi:hypothetical protein